MPALCLLWFTHTEDISEARKAGKAPPCMEQKARLLFCSDSGPSQMSLECSAGGWGQKEEPGTLLHSSPRVCESLYALFQGNIQIRHIAQFTSLGTLIE